MLRLLIAAQLAGALGQTPVATDKAVLSGRVVEQGSETPIAGAHVTLIEQFQGPPPSPFSYRPRTTTTDEHGRFQFADLAPARYRVMAQKPGFAMPFSVAPSRPLDLQAGQTVDTAIVALQRGGVVTGRVLDAAGEPVVDGRVLALRKGPPPDAPAEVAARFGSRLMPVGAGAQTDDRGEFRLHSLAPGEYYIQAAPRPNFGFEAAGAPGGSSTPTTTTISTFFPSTADVDSAHLVRVSAGQTEEGIAIRLLSAAAFQITGVIVDEAGQPVADAMVRLVSEDPNASPSPILTMLPQARTDTSGRFTLSGVTAGTYALMAMAPTVLAREPRNTGGSSLTAVGGSRGDGPSMLLTETRNGTTVQYREDAGSRTPVTVSDANITGLQLIVRRTGR